MSDMKTKSYSWCRIHSKFKNTSKVVVHFSPNKKPTKNSIMTDNFDLLWQPKILLGHFMKINFLFIHTIHLEFITITIFSKLFRVQRNSIDR